MFKRQSHPDHHRDSGHIVYHYSNNTGQASNLAEHFYPTIIAIALYVFIVLSHRFEIRPGFFQYQLGDMGDMLMAPESVLEKPSPISNYEMELFSHLSLLTEEISLKY